MAACGILSPTEPEPLPNLNAYRTRTPSEPEHLPSIHLSSRTRSYPELTSRHRPDPGRETRLSRFAPHTGNMSAETPSVALGVLD